MEKLIKESKKSAKQISPLESLLITTIHTAISATISKGYVLEQLATTIQNIKLQTEEIKKLQDQVKLLENQQNKSGTLHVVELQRAQNQVEIWNKLATESSIVYTLGNVKEIIWNKIIEEMSEIWPCVHIIFEKKELVEKENQTITDINTQLGEMPNTTNNIIKFLNSKDS